MNHFVVRKSVLWVCFFLVVYYILLELYYYYFVGVSYSRFLFSLDISLSKYVETKIIFILVLLFSIYVSRKSEFVYSVFIFFVIFFLVPGSVTYSFQNQISGPLYATIALLVSIGLISVNKIVIPNIRSISLSKGVILGLLILALMLFFYSFGFQFNLKNILLEDIHETRANYDENSSTLVNYLYNSLVKAVIPVLMVYFLIHKHYRYALITLFALLYLYLISGNKIVFITLFIMLFFYYAGKSPIYKTKYFLLTLLIGLLIIPLVDLYILKSHSLKGIFVMRTLFLPSHLNYLYFDFFVDKPMYFAESNLFNWFVTNPLPKPVGFVISETYFGASDMNSNNGIISDGYMNLGYLGIAINIMFIALLFLFFNSVSPDARYLGIFFVMIFLFLSAPMLSMIITNGVMLVVIMSWFFMRQGQTPDTTN